MNNLKVLIIDDEIISVMALNRCMQDFGYSICESAISVDEAMLTIDREHPDIILLDINLPGKLNGLQIAKKIKKNYDSQIVFITGYNDQHLRNEALNLNPIGYYIKPVDCATIHQDICAFMQTTTCGTI